MCDHNIISLNGYNTCNICGECFGRDYGGNNGTKDIIGSSLSSWEGCSTSFKIDNSIPHDQKPQFIRMKKLSYFNNENYILCLVKTNLSNTEYGIKLRLEIFHAFKRIYKKKPRHWETVLAICIRNVLIKRDNI